MSLQDASHDSSIIDWLQQSGHGHLLANQHQSGTPSTSGPVIARAYDTTEPYGDTYSGATSVARADNLPAQAYDTHRNRYADWVSSPTQFLAPHSNQHLYDADIENLKRDPNTRIVQRPPQEDVVYKQRVFVKYLQPPTPPPSGAIIVREKQLPQPPPASPLIIRRAPPPPPPTPPPVVIRERPPFIPPPEPTTIINKIIPAPPRPPRQVIIEQYPPLPPKPQNVIVERWLPVPLRQRPIIYERLPAPVCHAPKPPIIVQNCPPQVHIQREIFTIPPKYPCQQVSQVCSCQQTCSTRCGSSLISYSPHSVIQPTYGSLSCPQSDVIVMQSGTPNAISSSCYGMPYSCVCHSNTVTGLAGYGGSTTTVPTVGHNYGNAMVYQVPENVSVDHILRQFGIDSASIHRAPCMHRI